MVPTDAPIEILLVEDNVADTRLLQQFCRKNIELPLRWRIIEDGEAALAFLQQQGSSADAPQPQVIILDLGLPKRSGWDILATIRAMPGLRSIPVVILAGFLSRGEQEQRDRLKPTLYLQKPATLEGYQRVVTHIKNLLIHTAGNFASFFILELGFNSESLRLHESSI
jgi:two-component system response regulator